MSSKRTCHENSQPPKNLSDSSRSLIRLARFGLQPIHAGKGTAYDGGFAPYYYGDSQPNRQRRANEDAGPDSSACQSYTKANRYPSTKKHKRYTRGRWRLYLGQGPGNSPIQRAIYRLGVVACPG